MGKSCSRKRSKEGITFDKTAVVENRKIKNTHSQNNVAGTDIAEGAVCKSAAVKLFIGKVYV